MPTPPSVYSVVREILRDAPDLPTDEVVARAKAKGVNVPDPKLRHVVHNTRSELRKQGAKNGKPAAAGPKPKAAPSKRGGRAKPAPAPSPTPAPTPVGAAADLSSVLANVTIVNKALEACGGADNVRKAAEAVRACGGVEPFLMHVDIVSAIRSPRGEPGGPRLA